jgi:hypothetical protein
VIKLSAVKDIIRINMSTVSVVLVCRFKTCVKPPQYLWRVSTVDNSALRNSCHAKLWSAPIPRGPRNHAGLFSNKYTIIYRGHRKKPHRIIDHPLLACPLTRYAPPSMVVSCTCLQLSVRSVNRSVLSDENVINFGSDKRLKLADVGQERLERNTSYISRQEVGNVECRYPPPSVGILSVITL